MNKMFKLPMKLDLQMFADGDPSPTPTPQPTPTPAPTPEGKVWTDEYVSGLRAEAKENRLNGKKFEGLLRSVLGLKADDEINESLVTTYQKDQQKTVSDAMSKANGRLIAAEIKSMDGYDAKLLSKLIDHSKITIEDDGSVKGLAEQLADLEKEFPAIKAVGTSSGAVNPGAGAGGQTELQLLQEAYDKSTSMAEKIMLKNKIFNLQPKT